MTGELPAEKEAVSAFYEQIAAEFEKIADHLLGEGADNLEWLHALRFKAVEIRAGADSLASWLATLHSQDGATA